MTLSKPVEMNCHQIASLNLMELFVGILPTVFQIQHQIMMLIILSLPAMFVLRQSCQLNEVTMKNAYGEGLAIDQIVKPTGDGIIKMVMKRK